MARPFVPITLAVLALVAFFILANGNITATAPTNDEPVHLAAGWTYLTKGDFRLNPEHPPLLKLIAALPMAGARITETAGATEMWDFALTNAMAQWFYAHRLFYSFRDDTRPTTERIPRADFYNDTESHFLRARTLLLILTGLGLAAIIFAWSYELWGLWGAALSVLFFAFDPNFIAHCGLVTTDAGISFFVAGTLYFFWRIWKKANLLNGALFAIFFAAALLAKYSAVLMLPMLVLIALTVGRRQLMRLAAPFGAAILVSIVAIWAAYGFRFLPVDRPHPIRETVQSWYAMQSLVGDYPAGPTAEAVSVAMASARIGLVGRLVLLANDLHLLPQSYLHGFASVQQSAAFRTSFLRGVVSVTGFSDFFFWTFLYKTPIATIVAIVAGLFAAYKVRKKKPDVWFVILPVLVYLAIAVTANINIGHRHILPIFPFLYVLCGALSRRFLIAAALALVACLWSYNAPMWGHHLSYMNELARGPEHGHEKLLDSNFDWGQDLERLGKWLDEHKVTEPINLVYFGSPDPRYYGIRFLNLEQGYYPAPEVPLDAARPGLLAISASDLGGATLAVRDYGHWRDWLARRNAKLVGKAGYSIFIYRIE